MVAGINGFPVRLGFACAKGCGRQRSSGTALLSGRLTSGSRVIQDLVTHSRHKARGHRTVIR